MQKKTKTTVKSQAVCTTFNPSTQRKINRITRKWRVSQAEAVRMLVNLGLDKIKKSGGI